MKATEMRKRGIELAEKARALRGPIRVPQWEHSSSIIESALNHAKSTKELLGPIYVPELGTDTEAAPVYTRPQTLGEYTTMLFEGKKNGRNLETQVSHLMLDEDGARIFTSAYIDELTMFSNVAINRIYSDLQRLKNKTTDDNTGTAIYYRNITVGMDRTLKQHLLDESISWAGFVVERFLDKDGRKIFEYSDIDNIMQFDSDAVIDALSLMNINTDLPGEFHSEESLMSQEDLGNSSTQTVNSGGC